MNQITKQSICDRLLDTLPHGSGINGDWSIEYNPNTRAYYASNYYEAMNEVGMYCHTYEFIAKYRYNGEGKTQTCPHCNGLGTRPVANVAKARNESIEDTRIFFRLHGDMLDDDNIACWTCDGKGFNTIPEWELLNINFHRERCGYGLKDYLYETLTLD